MQLSDIEYNAVMMAINNAKTEARAGDFLDPYDENPDGYTNKTLLAALESVEDKLISTLHA